MSDAKLSRATFHPLRIAGVERLTDDAVALELLVPEHLREEFAFAAGQHLTVRVEIDGTLHQRSYSICSPVGAESLTIGVKQVSGGLVSSHLVGSVSAGDKLEVLTPAGGFGIEGGRPETFCCIAAGSGITPILSFISSELAAGTDSRMLLVYGNRSRDAIMFSTQLHELQLRYPDRFAIVHVLSRDPQDATGASGRIEPGRLEELTAAVGGVDGVDHWLLCAPEVLLSALRADLVARGVPDNAIHFELFRASDEPVSSPIPAASKGGVAEATVTLILDGEEATFSLAPDGESILERALELGADVPFACQEGICATCRAKVVEGDVNMDRNYSLDSAEVAEGYVLTCQSHPVSPRVVVDYDA